MIDRILRLFFPPTCVCCGELMDWYTCKRTTVLCGKCLKGFADEREETCDRCAKRIGECRCMPPVLKRVGCRGFFKLVNYHRGETERASNRLIYTVKNREMPRVQEFLAAELAPSVKAIAREAEDPSRLVLTYVPRSAPAKRKNGTDQAQMLARALSATTGVPMKPLFRRRFGSRKIQKKLSFEERMKNADSAFALIDGTELKNVSVILVDDVVTTGASMAACIRQLHRVGVKRVYSLAVATNLDKK